MRGRITIATHDGHPVVVKTAPTGVAGDALRRECDTLHALGHPRVVEVSGFTDHGDTVELRTAYIGPTSLADADLGLGDATSLSAATAALVEDLHRSGLAHGGLTADHVLIADDGGPVLCSFSRATPLTDESARADLAALGTTFAAVARRIESAGDPQRRHRRIVAQWRHVLHLMAEGHVTAAEASALLAEIHASLDDAPRHATRRLGAGVVATGTRSWRDRVVRPAEPTRGRSTRSAAAVLAVVACLLAGWFGAGLTRPTPERPAPVAGPAASGPTSALVGRALVGAARSVAERSVDADTGCAVRSDAERCVPACGAIGACADRIEVVDNLVRVGADWFRLGDTGDVVVVGDWNCDGYVTPAMLRARTGEVFVFAQWAAPDERSEALPLAVVTGATTLIDPTERCPDLVAVVGERLVTVEVGEAT